MAGRRMSHYAEAHLGPLDRDIDMTACKDRTCPDKFIASLDRSHVNFITAVSKLTWFATTEQREPEFTN